MNYKFLLIFFALFVSLFLTPIFPQTAQPERWEELFSSQPLPGNRVQRIEGRVVGVHDGDTCTVLDANKNQHKIRFDGIDAPELKQDFGNRAKQNLSDLIFGKQVTVLSSKSDKYGRTVGKVMIDGRDANLYQIQSGFAWHYKKYQGEQSPEDRRIYAEAELKAKASKLGIWSQADILPPWDYRNAKKESQAIEKANRQYLIGPRGGCYYINSAGNKTSVDRKFCNSDYTPKSISKADDVPVPSSTSRTYLKGEKGGCYYINASGKKTYVDKAKCN